MLSSWQRGVWCWYFFYIQSPLKGQQRKWYSFTSCLKISLDRVNEFLKKLVLGKLLSSVESNFCLIPVYEIRCGIGHYSNSVVVVTHYIVERQGSFFSKNASVDGHDSRCLKFVTHFLNSIRVIENFVKCRGHILISYLLYGFLWENYTPSERRFNCFHRMRRLTLYLERGVWWNKERHREIFLTKFVYFQKHVALILVYNKKIRLTANCP